MNVYLEAWREGLKGITIFRDGCARQAILTTSNPQNNDSSNTNTPTLKRGEIIQCSDNLIGRKRKLMSGCGSLHVLAYFDPITGEMQEVYLNMGSGGGCLSNTNALSRAISLLLRAGVDIYSIKDQLDSVFACPAYATRTATKHDTSKGRSCPSSVGYALVEMWEELRNELGLPVGREKVQPRKVKQENIKHNKENDFSSCPECGAELQHVGGCVQCPECSWSKCN